MRWARLFPQNSIRRKLLLGISLVGIPPLAVLFYQNYYALSVLREKAGESYQRAVAQYLDRVDDNLGDADRHLRALLDSDAEVLTMAETDDENLYRISKMRLGRRFIESILLYSQVDVLFAYSERRDDFLEIFSAGGSLQERQSMREVVRGGSAILPPGFGRERDWRIMLVGDAWYLLRALKTGDLIIGAWCRVDRLLEEADLFPPENQATLLAADEYGAPLTGTGPSGLGKLEGNGDFERFYAEGASQPYLVVGAASEAAPIRFHAIIPDSAVVRNLPYLQWVILMVSVATVFFFPIGALIMLRKTVVIPLERMLRAITSIREGKASGRIIPIPASDEFRRVTDAFNAMMSEIDQLRISVYEEQLAIHREELLRLRAQVDPHFFLNSINMIYSLVSEKDYDRVSEAMLLLASFFRYSVRNSSEFVPLGEELSHVEDYFRIQRLRFQNEPVLETAAPDFLLDQPVPPLILQTFVENSFRHGALLGKRIQVTISADHVEAGGKEFLSLRVSDNGRGFSADYLDWFGGGKKDGTGAEHIGIRNAQRRLELLYDGRAGLSIGNGKTGEADAPGSWVELLLPIEESGGLPGEGLE